jgi:gamma-glutamyltranspeptidase/glutathione hydrolase
MEMLLAGGNAVDAAVATAIALTVVEPNSNGIGGDAFALVWDGKLHGLNASGKSPQAMTPEKFTDLGHIPQLGWLSVTVPGTVSGWRSLSERWGKLPFERLFEPAIRYAEQGYPVSPETSVYWQRGADLYLPQTQPEFSAFQHMFFPNGQPPRAGSVWRSPAHAATLREIAQTMGESFYRGKLATQLAEFAATTGGLITLADLAQHQPLWVEPIACPYRDVTVWGMPPNTQGIATLMALSMLNGVDLAHYPRESAESYHWQIEAMKLALADVHRYVADPDAMTITSQDLLNPAYLAHRYQQIGETAMPIATPGLPQGGTVYLAAADENLIVSMIQSNYMGFGSGLLVPGTGIALHDRALGFTLEAGHPNQVAPGKRPWHSIIPGFVTQAGQPIGAFGVMGGPMQPQGQVQVMVNLVDYGLNPQAALDAPRWRFVEGNRVMLERSVPDAVVDGLRLRQHQIQRGGFYGRGQMILRHNGVLIAASDPRADGLALAW